MYEARQNKENVSRTIGGGGMARQMVNVRSRSQDLGKCKKRSRNNMHTSVQLKVINGFDDNPKVIADAIDKIKKNQYGSIIYKYLDETIESEIRIIRGELSNASKDEIRIKIDNDSNLDSTILHEMIHVVHAIVDDDQFNLARIYRGLLKLYFRIRSEKFPENISNSFDGYFNLQEEELVTQEWEKRYNESENINNKRNIPVRKHYMDESRFTNGENTGRIKGENLILYKNLYKIETTEDYIDINRLNSYDDFIQTLQNWKNWLETYVKEELLGNRKWEKDKIIKERKELMGLIEEKIQKINTVKNMIPVLVDL